MRTDTNALPVAVIETNATKIPVPNLQLGMKYFLSAKGQSNGVWSAESPFYVWPHPREDYFAVMNHTLSSPGGTKTPLPGTLKTFTNLPGASQFVGVSAWASNNITPFITSQ